MSWTSVAGSCFPVAGGSGHCKPLSVFLLRSVCQTHLWCPLECASLIRPPRRHHEPVTSLPLTALEFKSLPLCVQHPRLRCSSHKPFKFLFGLLRMSTGPQCVLYVVPGPQEPGVLGAVCLTPAFIQGLLLWLLLSLQAPGVSCALCLCPRAVPVLSPCARPEAGILILRLEMSRSDSEPGPLWLRCGAAGSSAVSCCRLLAFPGRHEDSCGDHRHRTGLGHSVSSGSCADRAPPSPAKHPSLPASFLG